MNSLAPNTVLNNSDQKQRVSAGADGSVDFERAVGENRAFLMRIAVASTRNVSDAEDVVQDALMRAHRGIQNFRGDCPIRIWLARIVVRVAINHRRSLKRIVQRWTFFGDLEREDADGRPLPFEGVDESSRRVDREAMIDMERHVSRLPEEFRVPLLMLAVDGMTIPEISAILEIPEGTVKSRIFYGRKRLKKSLKL